MSVLCGQSAMSRVIYAPKQGYQQLICSFQARPSKNREASDPDSTYVQRFQVRIGCTENACSTAHGDLEQFSGQSTTSLAATVARIVMNY